MTPRKFPLWKGTQFSPDGRTFAVASTVGDRFAVEWRDFPSGRLLRTFDKLRGNYDSHISVATAFQFSVDGAQLILVGNTGVETVPLDGSKPTFFRVAGIHESAALSADGAQLFVPTSYDDHPPKIYDVRNQRVICNWKIGRDFTVASKFSPDSTLLAACDTQGPGEDAGCWIADVKAKRKLWDWDWGQKKFEFSPDSQTILIFDSGGGADGTVEWRAAKTGHLLRHWKFPFVPMRCAFTSEGTAFYAFEFGGKVWKTRLR